MVILPFIAGNTVLRPQHFDSMLIMLDVFSLSKTDAGGERVVIVASVVDHVDDGPT